MFSSFPNLSKVSTTMLDEFDRFMSEVAHNPDAFVTLVVVTSTPPIVTIVIQG